MNKPITSGLGPVTKRELALIAIKAAGARGDRQTFIRLYVENRISHQVAKELYDRGARFAKAARERG